MNKNTETYFSRVPTANVPRSMFDLSKSHKTSFNSGSLIPIFCREVLPGDTWQMTTRKVVRAQTMLTPILDNMYLDTFWFFVPTRLIWDHWIDFCGENRESPWVPQTQYTPPLIKTPKGGFAVGTIADHLGIPPLVEATDPDSGNLPMALPFRAYAKICEDWFRDQNLSDPLNIPLGDQTQDGTNGDDYVSDVANGGMPFKVAKYHDRFTSALPDAQKGSPVMLPGMDIVIPSGSYPVLSSSSFVDRSSYDFDATSEGRGAAEALRFYSYKKDGTPSVDEETVSTIHRDGGSFLRLYGTAGSENVDYLYPANLFADYPGFSGSVGSNISINDLRIAFATQQFLERLTNGSRYGEIIRNFFGVVSPDARLQQSEYLGGNRITIQVHQVTNSAQSEGDFLGDLGAMSVTSDVHADFEKSFTEHGYLMGLCCVRYDHTYSQGLEPMWTRREFLDFYNPVFANIGAQPIMSREIYWAEDSSDVFGYGEAWNDYRFSLNSCSGEMRPGVPNSLASWHLADLYETQPTLSDSWIREDPINVDRVLAVKSPLANQFFADFYFDCRATRPLPMYSIPGLERL